MPARNVFHSRAKVCSVKQEEEYEYCKRLVDIERKCEFNRITPEEVITYKFVPQSRTKKARDKFIKEPLELRTVLETIEVG